MGHNNLSKNGKFVISVSLIILGLLFIFGGLGEFQTVSSVENEISLLNKTALKFFGGTNSNLFGMDDSEKIFRNEKIKCLLPVLLGIAGAIGGTLLLKKDSRKSSKADKLVNAIKIEDSLKSDITDKVKIESDEDKRKNDNLRWMHPDMREQHNKPSFK